MILMIHSPVMKNILKSNLIAVVLLGMMVLVISSGAYFYNKNIQDKAYEKSGAQTNGTSSSVRISSTDEQHTGLAICRESSYFNYQFQYPKDWHITFFSDSQGANKM